MQFSDTTNKTGLIELLEDLTDTNSASSSSYSLAKKTRDINSAFAQFKMLADRASGTWENDDTNQTDYPIVKLNLVSGQRDYPFTVDGSSTPNQILDVYRVECAVNSSGLLQELYPFDQSEETSSLAYLASTTGIPYRYDKLANSIWLDQVPNFSSTASTTSGGIWLYVNRTPVYFTTADTTKKPGIPDMFHEYLAYRPAYLYCASKGLASAGGYLNFLLKMEKDIGTYFSSRNRDEHKKMTMKKITFR